MYLQRLSDTLQLPVTVDAEAGMPMDLARLEYLWLGDSTHPIEKEEESTSIVDEKLDEDDAFLLTDLAGSQSNEMEDMAQDDIPVPSAMSSQGLQAAQAQAASVTWLRRTEYLGAEQQRKQRSDSRPEHEVDEGHGVGEEGAARHSNSSSSSVRAEQMARIEQGFVAANTPIESLVHPSKPHVRATSAYELLPDPETWATSFQVVRFASALGRVAQDRADPRLDAAILRPVTDPLTGQQRVSMYLTCADTLPQYGEDTEPEAYDIDSSTQQAREDVAAARFKKRRRLGVFPRVPWLEGDASASTAADANVYGTGFRHVRDLEPIDQPASTDHWLAVVLDDHRPDPAPELASIQVDASISAQVAAASTKGESDDLFGDDDGESESYPGGHDDSKPHAEPGSRDATDDVSSTVPPQSAQERTRQEQVVSPASQDRQVAYYHPIDMRYGLRIRRTRKAEQRLLVPYEGFWHRLVVGHRSLTERETAGRLLVREGVDRLDMEGVEYEDEPEEATQQEAEGQGANDDHEDDDGVPHEHDTDGEGGKSPDAHDRIFDEGHEKDEESEANHDHGGDDDSGDSSDDDSDLHVAGDELADLQAEADLHPDDMPTEGRRRRRGGAD